MTESRSVVAGGEGKERQEVGLPRGRRKLLRVMDMFIVLIVVMG